MSGRADIKIKLDANKAKRVNLFKIKAQQRRKGGPKILFIESSNYCNWELASF